MDYFELDSHAYLCIADRFSGWITIYHFPHSATSRQLISICRASFMAYGVSEEVSSDGGPQFTSHDFRQFLQNWGVRHRLSSAEYPQSNGRAEVGVKTAKRIIHKNASRNGSLDNDSTARAILQYRNTPIPEVGLSPAQMLLHRQLRDSIPVHPGHYQLHKEWILSAKEREKAFAGRNKFTELQYNVKAHPLPPLAIQTSVRIQSGRRWNKTGHVVEVLPNRQYHVRVDGSGRLTLRNRRFLRVNSQQKPIIIPSPSSASPRVPATIPIRTPQVEPTIEAPHRTEERAPHINEPETAPEEEALPDTPEEPILVSPERARKLPKALRDIADYNSRGAKEGQGDMPSRLRSGR